MSENYRVYSLLERIYNPIMAMGFSLIFIFQLDNRVSTIWEILEILKGESISLKFWLKIFGKMVSDLL